MLYSVVPLRVTKRVLGERSVVRCKVHKQLYFLRVFRHRDHRKCDGEVYAKVHMLDISVSKEDAGSDLLSPQKKCFFLVLVNDIFDLVQRMSDYRIDNIPELESARTIFTMTFNRLLLKVAIPADSL